VAFGVAEGAAGDVIFVVVLVVVVDMVDVRGAVGSEEVGLVEELVAGANSA